MSFHLFLNAGKLVHSVLKQLGGFADPSRGTHLQEPYALLLLCVLDRATCMLQKKGQSKSVRGGVVLEIKFDDW
jgi:hypothetical protein